MNTKTFLTAWFTADYQWAVNFNEALREIDSHNVLVNYGLQNFSYLCTRTIYAIDQDDSSFDAALAHLLFYEDMIYMKDMAIRQNVNFQSRYDQLDNFRMQYWKNTILLPNIFPNLIPPVSNIEDKGEEAVFNADTLWANDFANRMVLAGALYPLDALPVSHLGVIMYLATLLIFHEYRAELLVDRTVSRKYINSVEKADGIWWQDIYNLTKWDEINVIATRMLESATR